MIYVKTNLSTVEMRSLSVPSLLPS